MAATVYRNAVIGGAGLPWTGAVESQLFADVAAGRPLIMGRKTYEQLRGNMPLPDTVVISRDMGFFPRDVMVRTTISAAYNVCARIAKGLGARESVVIGGAQIFHLALPWADRLYLASVDAPQQGPGHFPLLRPAEWESLPARAEPPAAGHPGYEMRTYQRRTGPAARAAMVY